MTASTRAPRAGRLGRRQTGPGSAIATATACTAFVAAWSSGFLVAKVGTTDAHALTLLLWRFLPLAVVLVTVTLARRGFAAVRRSDLRDQGLVALTGQLGYTAFVYVGVMVGVASGTVALIDAVQPLVIATLAGPVLGVAVRASQWLGLLVGAIGTGMVVWSQSEAVGDQPLWLLFPLAAMGCLIVATLLDRRRPSPLPILTVLTLHAAVTAGALLVLCAVTGTLLPPSHWRFWLAAVIAAAGPTLVGYGLYWHLLRRVGVTVVNALLFLVAPVTAVAGALLFGEILTVITWVGFAAAAGGVALVLAGERRDT